MAKHKRDYRAEYARRIARAAEKGYSRAVARGHAPRGTVGIKRAKQLNIQPGFVLIRKKPRKGFVATPKTRRTNLRNLGIAPSDFDARFGDVITDQDLFIDMLKQAGFSEREAYTLWFS
jgi:hypothetical protein